MVMELHDSQYLLILAPALLITLMFLFFWLFMKETSYDEVLARQKRDLKLPPGKPDSRRKNDKKKSKKKEKKQQAAAARALASALPPAAPTAEPTVVPAPREINGSKPTPRKNEPPPPVTKQPSPPPAEPVGKKKGSQKKQKIETDEPQLENKIDLVPAPVKKEAPVTIDVKLQDGAPAPPPTVTTGSGKKKSSSKKQKTEPVPQEETLISSISTTLMDSEPHKDVPVKISSKKMKNETDRENAEVKLKEFLAGLRSLALSEEEAVSVAAVLREKSPSALEAWHRSAGKSEYTAQQLQERERLLATLQEEASIAKEKVKQLSQELQVEKQKTGRAEAMVREQRGAMEKELSVMQAKAQGSYQEAQNMQIKFQQMREQLEGQIGRLQQENGILRDAVSTASNQMESKQSAELNKLRSDYTALMKELAENNGKLQQEELQRKTLEVNYKQNVSQLEAQLQDTKRRWEDLQNYLHSVNAEREKLQAAKQELQNQLLGVESEISNKNKEIQTLHSTLTDTMVSKEQLEHKVMELLEVSQHSRPDDSQQLQDLLAENKVLQAQIENLQAQISTQTTTASHFEELQKLLAEKELQRKSLEDSLNAERSSVATREINMQAMHTDNMTLKAEVQKLQAQISEQAGFNQDSQLALDQFQKSVQEKEEKIKMVEKLLETGLIEMANKEEELQALKKDNNSLKEELESLQQQATQQLSSGLDAEQLHRTIQGKDEGMKLLEEKLQAELQNVSKKETTIEALEQQLEALRAEVERGGDREVIDTGSNTQLQELQTLLASSEEAAQRLQRALEEKADMAAETDRQLKALQEESALLRDQLQQRQSREAEQQQEMEQLQQQSAQAMMPSQELLTALAAKDSEVAELQCTLAEVRESLDLQKKKNNESQEALESVAAESREVLHRLHPSVPLPASQNHREWLRAFESSAKEVSTEAEPTPASAPASELQNADVTVLTEKLKESEEAQKVLQKDCETYKKVLAETEGILQRLQSSVEQEESRWRVKLELAQSDLKEMTLKVALLESDVERLGADGGELENLRRDKQHLESELERAELESATYVTEVRELKDLLTELQSKLDGSYTEAVRQNEELNLLKTQLSQTLSKLKTEEMERQKVAGDLYKAQQSLDLIQAEILKEAGQVDLIENSTIATQREEMDRNEKMTAGLNQTVRELQQLLQAVNRQLTKGQEGDGEKDTPEN